MRSHKQRSHIQLRVLLNCLVLCIVISLQSACSTPGDADPPDSDVDHPPSVYTVNYPLAYFAERIGGDSLNVEFPAPSDEDPAYWRPDDQTVRKFQSADIILANGANYAKWMNSVSLPESKVVNTSAAFSDRLIEVNDGIVHQHGPSGEHSHHGVAFTTWLDPTLAISQAEAVEAAFAKKYPDSADVFRQRLDKLRQDLMALDKRLDEANSHYEGEILIASHPVYQYLSRRCGWQLKSLHWEPDETPSETEWASLEEWKSKTDKAADWMIWERQPLPEIEQRLNAIGIASVVFLPCGNAAPSGDYLSVMLENVDRLQAAFEKSRGPELDP